MSRPDLIRSWASDALGVFAPDYLWHPRAQVWQQEGAGEASVQELWGGDLERRARMVHLEGVGQWWPEETPAPVAEALTSFWAGLPDPERALATNSQG